MRMVVITDVSGRVIAACHVASSGSSNVQAGLFPIGDQRMVEVDVPEHLRVLELEERLKAVLQHCVPKDTQQLRPVEPSAR